MGRVSHQGVPLEMIQVGPETELLEHATGWSPWIRRVAMLVGLVTCLVLWGVGVASDSLSFVRAMMAQQLSFHYRWGGSGLGGTENDFLFDWQSQVAPDLPITGDSSRFPDLDDESQALRERFPEDLAVLQEHLSRRSNEAAQFMTEEERALVDRLDPDNALWLVLEAEWLRDKAYGREAGSYSYMTSSSSSPVDADLLAEAWQRYTEAGAKALYRDHSPQLVRRQIDAFPPDRRFMESMVRSGFTELIFSVDEGRLGYYGSSGSEDMEKWVAGLVKDKDLEGLKHLGMAWKALNRLRAGASGGNMTEGSMVGLHSVETAGRQLSDGFSSLGEAELSTEFGELTDRLSKVETRTYVMSGDPLENLMPIRADLGTNIPAQLTAEELKPGRMAERAFFDRLLSWFGVFVLLLLVLACGFEAYRRSLPVKGMARGLMPLFTWRDQAWVAGLGVAAPWIFWWALTRLTPMGFRDRGMTDEWTALGWLLQASIFLLLIMVMLVQTVQWRWTKRGAFLGFRGRVDWLGWVVAGMVALGVPAVSVVGYISGGDDEKGLFLLGMVGLGLVGLLWLLWVGGMNLFTPRHSALRANVVSRVLLPWSIASVGLMLLCAGTLFVGETSWFEKDTLFPLSTSDAFTNAFEERAMGEIHESFRSVWEEE